MQPMPSEFVPAVLAAAAICVAALLGSFTYVVAQATARGADRQVQQAKMEIAKAGPPTVTARAPR